MKLIRATQPITRDALRSIAPQAVSRSVATARSRRDSANHAAPVISAAMDAASGDRAEIRKPPTVVRKPPLTARMTATTVSAVAKIRKKSRSLFRTSRPQDLKTLPLRNRPVINLAAVDVELLLRLP